MANLAVSFEWIGNCTEDECTNKALIVCEVHKQLLCSCCVSSLHGCCKVTEIGNTELVEKAAEITESLIKRIQNYGKNCRLETRYPGYDQNLKLLVEELDQFKLEAEKVKNDKNFSQVHCLQEKVFALKAKVDTSYWFSSFSAFKAHRYEANKARGVKVKSLTQLDLEQRLEETRDHMSQEYQKAEDLKLKEEEKRLTEKYEREKAEIQQQADLEKQEIQSKTEQEVKLKEDQLKDLKEQIKERVNEMQKTIDNLNEEAKFNEMVIENANVQEIRLALLKTVYSTTMGSKVDFTNDSKLVIDLREDKGKRILFELKNKHFNSINLYKFHQLIQLL